MIWYASEVEFAVIAQLAERHHGKVEVLGPIPSDGSNNKNLSRKTKVFII